MPVVTTRTDAGTVASTAASAPVKRLVQAGLAVATLAGLLVSLWQWRSPDAFPSGASGYGAVAWPVGEPIYIGLTHEGRDLEGTIDIRDLQPDVAADSAESRVEYFICTVDPRSGVGSVGSVGATGIKEECSALVQAIGQVMTLNARPREQVVMAVTATRPGTVRVRGTELSYSYGWRDGTQYLGDSIKFTAVE